mgnify:CR=1 FL=1
MSNTVTLGVQDYLALVHLARRGTEDNATLEAAVARINAANGLVRYALAVRWRDKDAVGDVPSVEFPESWPPYLMAVLDKGLPVSKADVTAMVYARTPRYFGIQVSRDLSGTVGWQDLEVYFP